MLLQETAILYLSGIYARGPGLSDWTVGLDCGTGLSDWTVGLDCRTGLSDWTVGLDSQKVVLIQFKAAHTHYYTTVYLHHVN